MALDEEAKNRDTQQNPGIFLASSEFWPYISLGQFSTCYAEVTSDHTESRIHNTELHQLCQEIDKLPDGHQQVVVSLMDSLIKKHKFERILANQI